MTTPDTSAVENYEENDSADLANAIKADASSDYQESVPTVLSDDVAVSEDGNYGTLNDVWNVLNANPSLQNEFANALIGRIALTLIKSKSYMNPYAMFKKGILSLGEVVQEIWVDLVRPHRFNPSVAEEKWMERELPKIYANYYRINSKAFYKVTVSTQELALAFQTANGLTDLVGRIIGRLPDSLQYDEFMLTKYLIARHILDGHFAVETLPTENSPDDDIVAYKGVSNAMIFMSTAYNPAGVLTNTNRDEQYLFLSAKDDAVYDVKVLASAFNMDRAEFLGHRILFDNLWQYDYTRMKELVPGIPTFTDEEVEELKTVRGAIVDINALMIFDDLLETRQAENGEGLYWQHWLHSWKTLNMSPFENQVVFVEESGEVTALEIIPSDATGVRGKSVFFRANATLNGIASGAVTWSIDSTISQITTDGQLMISSKETADTITVTATSIATPDVTASVEVAITDN